MKMFNDKKTRNQDELLQEKRRILLVARIAIGWGREDLLSELEMQLEQMDSELRLWKTMTQKTDNYNVKLKSQE